MNVLMRVFGSRMRAVEDHLRAKLKHEWCFTPRQQIVACHLLAGWTIREIADTLDLHEGTIKGHVRAMYRKLQVQTRAEFVLWVAFGGPDK